MIRNRLARLAAALAAFALALAVGAARGEDCAYRPAPGAAQGVAAVADYRSILHACARADGASALAIRSMRVGGAPLLLLADPQALTARLERAACWTCREADESAFAASRMMRAVAASAAAPGLAHRGFLENAGLIHAARPGANVTGDLCPSQRPLDRAFFERLRSAGTPAPVGLAISGLWLARHGGDFRWLVAQRDAGRLDIVWINHSYHHPYRPGVPEAANFLLTRGVDPDAEILDTERLLIANGETPSLFFRFPGLVSDAPLMQAVRRHHLITLGADAWLALGQMPGPGSIVLVHPNGNEPAGLALFDRALERGAIARPLEPVTAAP